MISWLVFGALAVPVIGDRLSWRVVVYVVLSLTLVRMLPVALALLGAGFRPVPSRSSAGSGRAGWPRSSSRCWPWRTSSDAGRDVAVISLTVLVSVIAHGVQRRTAGEQVP